MTAPTVIYTPPKPEPKPAIPHHCPTGMWDDYREGTIVRCQCGKYWLLSGPIYDPWKRVRWYHFRAQRRIGANTSINGGLG